MSEMPDTPQQPGSALSDRLQQLDRRIASTVEDLVRHLHEELDRRLQEASSELQRVLEKVRPAAGGLPTSFLHEDDLAELMPPPAPAPAPLVVRVPAPRPALDDTLDPLLAAIARIDGEAGQANILKALLDESARFASRAVFVLIRGGEIRGWAGNGVADAAAQQVPFAQLGGPWARVQGGGGAVVLSADECADVAGQLGVDAAWSGVLIPFPIRGQIAGALYADRVETDQELSLVALQLLTHSAAQALETSQLRSGVSVALQLSPGEQRPAQPAAADGWVEPSAEPSAEDVQPAALAETTQQIDAAAALVAPAVVAAAVVYATYEPAGEPETEPEAAVAETAPDGLADEAAPSYEAPSYEAPSYEARSSSYEAPAYAYEAPEVAAPSDAYQAPAAEAAPPEAPESIAETAAETYEESPVAAYQAEDYSYEAVPSQEVTAEVPTYEGLEEPAPEVRGEASSTDLATSFVVSSYVESADETPTSYEPPADEPSAYAASSYSFGGAPALEEPSLESVVDEAPAPTLVEPSAYPDLAAYEPVYEAPASDEPTYELAEETPAAPSIDVDDGYGDQVATGVADPAFELVPEPEEAAPAPAYEAPAAGYGDVYAASSFVASSVEAPAYQAPAYESPAYEAPSYEAAPAYQPASFEPAAYETPASFEVPSYEAPAYEAPPYEAPAYAAPSFEEPTYEPPSYELPVIEVPSFDLPSDEEIALEAEAEPALEDTNIWAVEEDDDEPTQVGRARVVAPPVTQPAPPVTQPAPLGQQTVRLDISQLQNQVAAGRTEEPASFYPEPTPIPSPFEAPRAAPASTYDHSEAPTMLGRTSDPASFAAPAYEPPAYEPPAYQPSFAAPAYQPPAFSPPAYQPPPAPAFAAPSPAGFAGPAPSTEVTAGGGLAEPKEGGTEVKPPADLVGPGLAFSSAPARQAPGANSSAEEAMREEARRLARLLVSEIKLYNEEIIEEGRRSGNIYERMKDDIDRSRQMYEERIDPRLADQEDYFYQELVLRLAGGDARLLGI
jgi:hypothetical protein